MLAQLCRKTPSWQLIVVSGMLLVIATSINAMTMDVAKDKLAPFDQGRIQRSVEDPRKGDNGKPLYYAVWKSKGTKDVAPIFTLDGKLYNGGGKKGQKGGNGGSNIDTDGNIVSDDSNTDVGGGNGGNTDTDTDGGNDGNTDTDGGNTDGGNTNNGNTDGGNSDGGNTDGGNAGNNGGAGAGGTGDNSQAVGGDHQASGGTVGHGNGNGKEETETNVTNSPDEAGTTSIIFIIVALIVLAVVVVVVVVRRRRDENCNNNQLLAKKGKNHNKTYGSSLTMLEQDADVMWSNAFGDVADLGADYSTIDEVPRLHEFEFANLTPDNEYDFASSSPLRAKTKFIQPLLYSDVDATYTLPTKKDQAEEDLYEVIDRKDGTISSFDGFNVVPSDLVFDEMFEPELCDVYEDVSDERAPLFDDYSNASTLTKHKPAVPDRDYSPLSVRNSQSHEQQAQSEESQTSPPPLPPRVHVYDKAAKSQVANEKAAKEKKKKSQRPHVYNQAVKSVRTL